METTTKLEETSGEATKTISVVAFEEGRRLAGDPNILAVGHGAKMRGGTPVAAGSLVFVVRQKLQSAEKIVEQGSWVVPPSVNGFATDVVEVGRLSVGSADRALPSGSRGNRIDAPLVGGVATMGLGPTSSGPGGYGTLGGLCFDTVSGAPLLLSNAHVWGQTLLTEVVQPIMASGIFGASASPATVGTPPQLVQTRVPPALGAPVAFANAVAQTYLITGGDSDPLPFGQGATAAQATTRTDSETVIISAPAAGLPPAGRRLSQTVSWSYQRLSSTSVLEASSNDPRTVTKLLAARRLFTNATSYSTGQTVNLYAEIIPATGGAPATASAHLPLALLYPSPTGDKFIPRILKPAARQTPTLVAATFSGFPAPARIGAAKLPFVAGGVFTVDGDDTGAFQTVTGLPAGTFALKLPTTGTVRLFVPPSTKVILDIDLRPVVPAGGMQVQAVNSAGDNVGTVTQAAGTANRTLVTVSASEIVEVRLTGGANALLCGITSNRASPETAAPLSYVGTVSVADLLPKGRWNACLFVQAIDSGFTESANVVETAIGAASLVTDCFFDVV